MFYDIMYQTRRIGGIIMNNDFKNREIQEENAQIKTEITPPYDNEK